MEVSKFCIDDLESYLKGKTIEKVELWTIYFIDGSTLNFYYGGCGEEDLYTYIEKEK